MISFLRNLWRSTDGAVMAYTAILMPIFLGFIALGLDIASWHVTKRQIQTMADAAAVAAAVENERNSSSSLTSAENQTLYNSAAMNAAQLNGFDASTGDTIEINSPPTMGAAQGNVNAIEVIVRAELPLLLAQLVTGNGDRFAKARAVATLGGSDSCIYALDEDDGGGGANDGAIKVAGGAAINLGCGVISNSNISVSGGGSINATEVASVTGVSGNGDVNPDPTTTTVQSDPLGTLPEPENPGCDVTSKTVIAGNQDATLSPGVYCNDIQINTSGTVTFEPGTYIMDGGGISIGSQATVIGVDVFIFFTENSSASNNFDVTAGASVTFDAPDTGTYAGIFFFESRNAPDGVNHNFTGDANFNIDGVIYAPNADINYSGGSETNSNTFIVASTVSFTGQSTLTNLDPENPPTFDSPYFLQVDLIE